MDTTSPTRQAGPTYFAVPLSYNKHQRNRSPVISL